MPDTNKLSAVVDSRLPQDEVHTEAWNMCFSFSLGRHRPDRHYSHFSPSASDTIEIT